MHAYSLPSIIPHPSPVLLLMSAIQFENAISLLWLLNWKRFSMKIIISPTIKLSRSIVDDTHHQAASRLFWG